MLLIAVAVISVAAASSVRTGEILQRHNAEQLLLTVGDEFRVALVQYRQSGASPSCPAELTDLLRDPRFAAPRRHLRRIPIDPLTGQRAWGTIRNAGGQIAGVYSLSAGRPLKRAEFPVGLDAFSVAEHYSDWVFGACGQG